MRQLRPVLIAAALLLLLTIPIYSVSVRQAGAIINTPGPDDGPWPGQFEQVYAIFLTGLVVTNVLGLGAAVFVARQSRPTAGGALLLWAFAVAWGQIVNFVTSLVMVWNRVHEGPAGFASLLSDWLAWLVETIPVMVLMWMPGIVLGTLGVRWLSLDSEQPDPEQSRELAG